MDRRTDGQTDRPSYRDAWTHLKSISEPHATLGMVPSHLTIFAHNRLNEKKQVTDGQTDGQTDRPSYKDAWTHLKSISEPHATLGMVMRTSQLNLMLFILQ